MRMSGHEQASKVNTWEVWRSGNTGQCESIGRSEGGVTVSSSKAGGESKRVSGVIGEGGDSFISRDVAGKIVDELIAAQEKRAQEARECIDWYTREYEFAIQKTEELRVLREQINSGDETEPTE